ncbi:MAG: hypothetical protein LBG43_00540 [Treponema sp.]|jgi:hypothetical protein|nr:hypothetical protein [Treponema sp.]
MAEDALYSDDFMDPDTGYRKCLDVASFIDWRLANEIVKNYEIRLLNGQYMYYDPYREKLHETLVGL